MGTAEIVQLLTLVGTLLTVIGIVWKESRARAKEFAELKEEFDKKLAELKKEDTNKRQRIYQEIDRKWEQAGSTFVRHDMCQVLHGALKEASKDISSDVKRLLERAGVGNE